MRVIAHAEDAVIAGGNSKEAQNGFREAMALLEKEFDSISTTLMGTEEFAKAATVVSTIQLRLQKTLESHMARQLERFNMPSRDDIAALGERMMSIDERLIRIEDTLRRMDPQQARPQTNRPPRTKKPKRKSAAVSKIKRKKRPSTSKTDLRK